MVDAARLTQARASVALLTLSAFFGCFDTKIIPEGDGSGGTTTGGEGGTPDAAGTAGEDAGAAATGGSGGGQPNAGAGGATTGGSAGKGGTSATGGVNTTGGGAGKGGTSGTGGSAGKGGTSATGGTSTTGGVSTSGGASATGGAQSGGSGGANVEIDWLALEGSAAPSTLSPNAALGIDGWLYAYGDSCAVLDWDPTTRCASGNLCNSNNGENWGIAVGFDFNNTGPTGTPAATKLLWNPNDFGAQGVAWEISGTAPKFQVWVLNMDPVWNGQCSATACDIAGPPDGAQAPPPFGQLLFGDMMKDDWGGSGLPYKYDPAKVYALQFKLPAIIAGPASFSFCVKRVGVIH